MTVESRWTEQHWDRAYTGNDQHSWDQSSADISVALLEETGLASGDRVLDVGGGASPLAGQLLTRGVRDVSVLDISHAALAQARQQLGVDAGRVHWLEADLLHWSPQRHYTIWHDRAVFHFLTDRDRYRAALLAATAPGGVILIATFGPDGPTHCSRLPVARYGATELADALAFDAEILRTRTEDHHTPFATVQPFTWLALRRR